MLASLKHYWRTNLAVLLAVAVTCAVVTGALLVGDSVRGSLRALTLERLGGIDFALNSRSFFRAQLSESVSQAKSAAILLLNGSAVEPGSAARASQINVMGVDDAFANFFHRDLDLSRREGQVFRAVIVNRALASELGIAEGDQILLHFQRPSDIHRESLLGSSDSADQVETLRVSVAEILPDAGVGRFGLRPSQNTPLNAFVSRETLERAIGRPGSANVLLLGLENGEAAEQPPQALVESVHAAFSLEDLGLLLHERGTVQILESRQFVLDQPTFGTLASVAEHHRIGTQPVLTYLANRIEGPRGATPYSTVTGLDPPGHPDLPGLRLIDGSPAPQLSEDEVLLNEWTARDIGAVEGDPVRLTYYEVGLRDQLSEVTREFRVAGIVVMDGLSIDPALTPEFPGMHDAEDISAWDPPFPVDLSTIRPADEEYWDRYRAAPKVFLSLATAQRLWRTRFGEVTSLRLSATEVQRNGVQEEWKRALVQSRADLELIPVKQQGLRTAAGPTDFSGLFIGFSFFLIISALLIVGLLFRLGVEQRSRELGLLLSVGFDRRQVVARFLKEAALLAILGAALGVAASLGYAWALLVALRTWWLEAVGTTFLFLHVGSSSLWAGYLISVVMVLSAVALAVRKLVHVPKPLLLAGALGPPLARGSSGPRRVAIGAFAVALVLMGTGWAAEAVAATILFFLVGTALLIGGVALFGVWCRRTAGRRVSSYPRWPILQMASRSTARHPGRSLLSTALVASASFVIVAVGANRVAGPGADAGRQSGTGGFALVAQTDVPLLQDLSSQQGLLDVGFSEAETEKLAGVDFYSLRLLPGDDASCLNLYQPERPRVLGVPPEFVARGGFVIDQTVTESANPWELLQLELEPGVIPAFGDHESTQWILKMSLGDELMVTASDGSTVRLRLVGLISNSLFQSELLVSEENFLRYFPEQSGYSFFLIDAERSSSAEVSQLLEERLTPFGFDATGAGERLARFQAVRSTYISTFQTLGGLGLLLGTLGLGIVLIRGVLERRGELATLRAFGFHQSHLAWMVVGENAVLLILGLTIGSVAALVAVAPTLLQGGASLDWLSLALTLFLVLVVGMLASLAAVRTALKIPMLPALRAE